MNENIIKEISTKINVSENSVISILKLLIEGSDIFYKIIYG